MQATHRQRSELRFDKKLQIREEVATTRKRGRENGGRERRERTERENGER
jgi:hypothetical protein